LNHKSEYIIVVSVFSL